MVSELLPLIGRSLDKAGIPYMFIGGQAVSFYGRARFTEDIDLSLGVAADRFDDLMAVLRQLQVRPLFDLPNLRQWVESSMLLPGLHEPSGMRIDFALTFFDIEREAIARARTFEMDGYPIRVASLEDLILLKVIAGRAQDLADVKAMYARNQKAVDMTYLRQRLQTYSDMLAESLVERFEQAVAPPR